MGIGRKSLFWPVFVVVPVVVTLAACASPAAPSPAVAPTKAAAPTAAPAATSAPTAPAADQAKAWIEKTLAEAKKEGEVVVYTSNMTGDYGRKLKAAFESAYPGVTLQLMGGASGENQQKIAAEFKAGKGVADVYEGGFTAIQFETLTKSGASQPWGNLPSLADPTVFRFGPYVEGDPDHHDLVSEQTLPMYVIANTNLVKPADEPKNYADLLDPKWKGKILLDDPTRTGGGQAQLGALFYNKTIDMDYLRKLADNKPVLIRDYAEEINQVARGEMAISHMAVGALVGKALADGAPIKPVATVDPMVGGFDIIVTMTKASHPNAARLFGNWLLSKEGADARAKSFGNVSIRKDGSDYSPDVIKKYPVKSYTYGMAEIALEGKWLQEGTLNFFK